MKLAILSCGPHAYSTIRLKEAAKQRGHKVKVLNTLKFAIDVKEGAPDLYYRQKLLTFPNSRLLDELRSAQRAAKRGLGHGKRKAVLDAARRKVRRAKLHAKRKARAQV